jgi:hypothetical protein
MHIVIHAIINIMEINFAQDLVILVFRKTEVKNHTEYALINILILTILVIMGIKECYK